MAEGVGEQQSSIGLASKNTIDVAILPKFTIGRTLKHTFLALWRNALVCVPIGIAAHLVWLTTPWLAEVTDLDSMPGWSADVIDTVAGELAPSVLEVSLAFVILEGLRGRKGSMGDVGRGLASLFPAVGAAFVYLLPQLGIDVAEFICSRWVSVDLPLRDLIVPTTMFALIVPTAILAVAWCLYVPVVVFEAKSPIASLRRSAQLTKGRRWAVFGLFLIAIILLLVVMYFLSNFTGLPMKGLLRPQSMSIGSVIGFTLTSIVATYYTVLTIALYEQLRHEKGESIRHEMSQVFE